MRLRSPRGGGDDRPRMSAVKTRSQISPCDPTTRRRWRRELDILVQARREGRLSAAINWSAMKRETPARAIGTARIHQRHTAEVVLRRRRVPAPATADRLAGRHEAASFRVTAAGFPTHPEKPSCAATPIPIARAVRWPPEAAATPGTALVDVLREALAGARADSVQHGATHSRAPPSRPAPSSHRRRAHATAVRDGPLARRWGCRTTPQPRRVRPRRIAVSHPTALAP